MCFLCVNGVRCAVCEVVMCVAWFYVVIVYFKVSWCGVTLVCGMMCCGFVSL